MIKEEYKYSELTSKIIGCAMTVHSTLGDGFQEEIGLLINFGETSLILNGCQIKNMSLKEGAGRNQMYFGNHNNH
jgi:hypothetical protein